MEHCLEKNSPFLSNLATLVAAASTQLIWPYGGGVDVTTAVHNDQTWDRCYDLENIFAKKIGAM
jgi:hypothetical protein